MTPEQALEIVKGMRRSPSRGLLEATKRDRQVAAMENKILRYLIEDGGAYTAQDIGIAIKSYDTWDALRRLEKAGLVWRAWDYETWQTMHLFKITGCGRLSHFHCP